MTQVLIVDDGPDIRRLLRITLGAYYALSEAKDGVGALESIRQCAPEVVLLDVVMPGEMDGLQVLQAIRNNPQTRSIQVAVVSAKGQQADSDLARLLGADAYFTKPFSPCKLRDWVRDTLREQAHGDSWRSGSPSLAGGFATTGGSALTSTSRVS